MKYIKIILFFIFFISGNAISANNNQTFNQMMLISQVMSLKLMKKQK